MTLPQTGFGPPAPTASVVDYIIFAALIVQLIVSGLTLFIVAMLARILKQLLEEVAEILEKS